MSKKVSFNALPGVKVSGEIVVRGKKRWIGVSTEGLTCDAFTVEIDSDGDELTEKEVVAALSKLCATVREALLQEFDNLELAVTGPVV